MGIIGAGHIGKAIAKRAQGFDMKVLFNDLGEGFTPLDQLLKQSDFVVAACPLTEKTRNLISHNEIALMKPTAVLANIGRGPVFDVEAVADALEQKKIYGAALDVIDPEPFPPTHRILKCKNLVITPHIGSSTIETTNNMAIESANACVYFLNGERVPNVSNPKVYEK
ncbi:D-isomer specific 2-hydroxyacid dehydrogenase, putative [Trichomonas vaginalis G3]|uniref:D-isomer specific 2-hydroxyacid dehydrogenase, putative n=1 Tax=Trichomonas vaginalis (strain ATCC PRA-98 / G3) TaxID=412133 RepID=A2D763_TRIV3|nr:hydroxypyruvate reductase protein [Trichomonas vaginalis G3]EAY23580.1 D-isomer specific 2-hydroxyacid dehydrogenase, putative [Trichomonas vaginalis G3]KAI5490077.1 hydroxypyruvate reductase protein [Trichomonas vaginalis G3]|eukprot:XP_001276828.1 D-isomer specific 2-hydroxyacid dehydrogenase [Trichomonas vaginalis G3]